MQRLGEVRAINFIRLVNLKKNLSKAARWGCPDKFSVARVKPAARPAQRGTGLGLPRAFGRKKHVQAGFAAALISRYCARPPAVNQI